MNTALAPVTLTGLNGSNPLAFLATLGALKGAGNDARLSWREDLRPVLHVPVDKAEPAVLASLLAGELRRAKMVLDGYPTADAPSDIVKVTSSSFREFIGRHLKSTNMPDSRLALAFAEAFGSEAIVQVAKNKIDFEIKATRLSLANGNGGKNLLLQFRGMVADAPEQPLPTPADGKKGKKSSKPIVPTLAELVREAIFNWTTREAADYYSFRWDPAELRRYAHMARKPEDDKYSPIPGANLLAVLGLTLLPSFATREGLRTAGMIGHDDMELFVWPLWSAPFSAASVTALMLATGDPDAETNLLTQWQPRRTVFARFASERYTDPQKNAYMTPSVAL